MASFKSDLLSRFRQVIKKNAFLPPVYFSVISGNGAVLSGCFSSESDPEFFPLNFIDGDKEGTIEGAVLFVDSMGQHVHFPLTVDSFDA